MYNILDGLQCFYEREKLADEIEQGASEDQKYNALHSSCGGVVVTVPKINYNIRQTQAFAGRLISLKLLRSITTQVSPLHIFPPMLVSRTSIRTHKHTSGIAGPSIHITDTTNTFVYQLSLCPLRL